MTQGNTPSPQDLNGFIEELSGFAQEAEQSLNQLENSDPNDTSAFRSFSHQMIAIRGTAQQLHFPNIAHIAGLGEEISVKASSISSNHQKRKCMSSLWDALTTVKFMLENPTQSSSEEQQILVQRLESVLKGLGGARQTVGEDEIENLLKQNRNH